MSKLTARHIAASGAPRPRLAAVAWGVPSTEPDTSEVDDSSFEERPRHSFIALKGLTEAAQTVAYDVWESPHALLVLIDLPGVEARNLALSLGSQALYLEVSVPEDNGPSSALPAGKYEVRVETPLEAGPDAIDASLSNGLLRIRISKHSNGARKVAIVSPERD